MKHLEVSSLGICGSCGFSHKECSASVITEGHKNPTQNILVKCNVLKNSLQFTQRLKNKLCYHINISVKCTECSEDSKNVFIWLLGMRSHLELVPQETRETILSRYNVDGKTAQKIREGGRLSKPQVRIPKRQRVE